jgi:2-polyprenyl-3-methyl-5-hydroxy-6-metoxy-1,4-benzoquinol methylase
MIKCFVCNSKKFEIIWNDKIRISPRKFSKRRKKILQCQNCNLVRLEKITDKLEASSVVRKIFNRDNTVSEHIRFHGPRESRKFHSFKNYTNFNNKSVLEHSCGSGVILNLLKNKTKKTTGLDNKTYKNYVINQGHDYYTDINDIIKEKKKFDIITSMAEFEHKYDPKKFLINLKKILSKKGKILIRIPNFYNIYYFLMGKNFLRHDYRSSHNFYFSEKNLDILFNKVGFKVIKKIGLNEFDFNHVLTSIYFQDRVRDKQIKKFFPKKIDTFTNKCMENSLVSSSLLYILKFK